MRLLHERDDRHGGGAARTRPEADRRRDPRCARDEPVPLRCVRPGDPRGEAGSRCRRACERSEPSMTWGAKEPERVEERIRIDPDGTVVALSGKIEFGQGIRTAFAMLVADEMDLPIERVRVVLGDTAQVPWDMGTFGSRSIAQEAPALRRAAAYAKQLLVRGERVEGVIPDEVRFRPESERRYVGQPVPRLEARDIVTGRAKYVADIRL